MAIQTEALLEAIAGSMFIRRDVDGIQWIDHPGYIGRYSAISNIFMNIIGQTKLDEAQVPAVIDELIKFYTAQKITFGWFISPLTRPVDLASYLEEAGFELAREASGLALTDLSLPITRNPNVIIRQGNVDLSLPSPDSPNYAFALLYNRYISTLDPIYYYAYLDGIDEPVGFAAMFYIPGTKIVALQGAYTKEAYRGRGIYTSLMAQRLQVARADGMEAAIIQADKKTSAPICEKLGFEHLCDLAMYSWAATDATHD